MPIADGGRTAEQQELILRSPRDHCKDRNVRVKHYPTCCGGKLTHPLLKYVRGPHCCCWCGLPAKQVMSMICRVHPFVGIVCNSCDVYMTAAHEHFPPELEPLSMLFRWEAILSSWFPHLPLPQMVAAYLYPKWWPADNFEYHPDAWTTVDCPGCDSGSDSDADSDSEMLDSGKYSHMSVHHMRRQIRIAQWMEHPVLTDVLKVQFREMMHEQCLSLCRPIAMDDTIGFERIQNSRLQNIAKIAAEVIYQERDKVNIAAMGPFRWADQPFVPVGESIEDVEAIWTHLQDPLRPTRLFNFRRPVLWDDNTRVMGIHLPDLFG